MQANRDGSPTFAVEVRDLVKTYRGGVRALAGLNLSVRSGSVFALLGPNGAGKSTTIKILNTLSLPDSGQARIGGFDVLTQAQDVRRIIGCVAQMSGVDVESTGRENLTLQGQLHGLGGPELKRRVDTLLQRMSLAQAADRLARTYSGGMQRKLDIAMGLINQPKVLFLDEPTTGLDPEARADLWNEIALLSKEGLTVLLTTHYLEEADRLAEIVAIMDRGKKVAEGTPEALKAELQGDAIQVDLLALASHDQIRTTLSEVPGLGELQVTGNSLHVRAEHGASAVPAVLLALESQGLRVASVKVSRPSLDDVYLHHTGRTFAQAEGQS
ncbi:MAG: ATP-binding cassette domain-containing protein [Acidobacteriaceae bacterium]|nr:ATP-binding cassette domain-containing protein [Acidobacteriaceae bacterium]